MDAMLLVQPSREEGAEDDYGGDQKQPHFELMNLNPTFEKLLFSSRAKMSMQGTSSLLTIALTEIINYQLKMIVLKEVPNYA